MKINLTFRGMDHSGAIENYLNEKCLRLEKLLVDEEKEPINVDIVLTAARTHHHHEAEIHVRTARFSFTVKKENSDLYAVIDKVVDLAVDEIRKQKGKRLELQKEANQYRKI